MLLIQKYLENNTFEQLATDHGVYASFSKSGHKFSINYDQIEARNDDPLSQECRGLILCAENGKSFLSDAIEINDRLSYNHICPGKTKILAYPMRRFFNHGQGSAANIDWNDKGISVLEKMDGTLCILYFDSIISKWCVATRSVPEADLFMDNGIFTFRTLFEKALQETCGMTFDTYVQNLDVNITYCFELTTPYNRIIVKYYSNRVTLLAARDISSFKEVDINSLNMHGVPCVQGHTYTSVDDIVNWVSTTNPIEHEGVVIRDSNFNRIKVKSAAYTAYNRARDILGASDRNCLEIILHEKDDDVLPFLPEEIANNLIKIKEKFIHVMKHYDALYLSYLKEANDILPGDKKTFALIVSKNKESWTAPMFQIFSGKAENMKDFIQKNKKEGTWPNGFLDKILELAI